jgi:hypothetical protein
MLFLWHLFLIRTNGRNGWYAETVWRLEKKGPKTRRIQAERLGGRAHWIATGIE